MSDRRVFAIHGCPKKDGYISVFEKFLSYISHSQYAVRAPFDGAWDATYSRRDATRPSREEN